VIFFKNKGCWLKAKSSIFSHLVNQVMKGWFLMVILSVSQVFNYSLHHSICTGPSVFEFTSDSDGERHWKCGEIMARAMGKDLTSS